MDLDTERECRGDQRQVGEPVHTDVPDWYLRDRIDDGVRVPAEIWRRSLAGLCEAEPPTEIGAITARTLVIRGGRDELIPRADTEALVSAIAGAGHA